MNCYLDLDPDICDEGPGPDGALSDEPSENAAAGDSAEEKSSEKAAAARRFWGGACNDIDAPKEMQCDTPLGTLMAAEFMDAFESLPIEEALPMPCQDELDIPSGTCTLQNSGEKFAAKPADFMDDFEGVPIEAASPTSSQDELHTPCGSPIVQNSGEELDAEASIGIAIAADFFASFESLPNAEGSEEEHDPSAREDGGVATVPPRRMRAPIAGVAGGAGGKAMERQETIHRIPDFAPPSPGGILPRQETGRYAYVVLLFGGHPGYYIEAAVLGVSLRNSGTQHDMVLLHTQDVPSDWLSVLEEVGWQARLVDKLEGQGLYDGSQNNRFDGVFTKLHVLALSEYDKVVMMDADLLVRKNVDVLFDRKAPAALRRHASADYPDGEKIPRASFFDSRGQLVSGINAGVMVLQPSASDFRTMVDDLANGKRHKSEASRMPEQDYLTRFYADDWHSLGVQFNYQPHQMAFTDRRGLESCTRLSMDFVEEVYIVHFSALPKPRDWLFCPEYCAMARSWFAMDVLFEHYLEGIWKDRRSGYSRLDRDAIEAQLRCATYQSTMEWFEAWDRLVARIPRLSTMVADAAQSHPMRPRRFSGDRGRSRSRRRSQRNRY